MHCSEMYVPLLLCGLFAMASMTSSTPETKNTTVTVRVNDTTMLPTTARVNVLQSAAWTPQQKLDDVPTTAPAENTVLPIVENNTSEPTTVSSKTSSPDGSRDGSVVVTAVAAGTSSSGLPASTEGLITKPETPAGTTSRGAVQTSTYVSMATPETPPSPSVFIEVTTSRGEVSAAASTALTETQPSTVATTATDEVHPSFSTSTATSRAQYFNYTTADVLNHTDHLHQSSTPSFTNETTSSTALANVDVSSLQPTAISGNTSELLSPTPLNNQTVSTFSLNPSHPTESSPTSKTSPELSSTSKSASTSPLNSTTRPSETVRPATTTSPRATIWNSTSAAGVPLKPKRLPFSTTRSIPAATIPPCEQSKDSPGNQIQPCSTRAMANQCLVIIASLAAVATIFMISTIVLCVKLSARTYKVRKPQQSTEMMCISALLPERTYTYTRQRNPVSNGVLVFPAGGDSDEEGGDNLTLSSFLPDNDRYV